MTRLTDLLGVKFPLIQAGMAGGPTTPELVAAVCNAGALGTLGAGYLSPDELRDAIRAVRRMTDRPFAVNLIKTSPVDADGPAVMRAQERLVAIRSHGAGLVLCTMRFPDELRDFEEIAPRADAARPSRKAVERAVALIEELSADFEPESYRDEHRAHLERIIERKHKGERVRAPARAEAEPTVAPDLMGALEESLARIRGQREGESRRGRRARAATESAPSASPRRPRSTARD